jgi:flagellin
MPSVINTNIPSLNTQRNLGVSQAALGVSIQRLSTGLRVNSAKDDAAGLAIAERMNAQVRGLNVAARNANDGVSLAQTAEGALGKIGEMVQRMRELAVQSSNATNSDDDRTALQAEVNQLKQEIGRVANTTNFNGTKLLDGSFASRNFQVGADAGQSIKVDAITNAQLTGMGAVKLHSVAGTPTVTAGVAEVPESAPGAGDGTPAVPASAAQIAAGAIVINGVEIGQIDALSGSAATVTGRANQLRDAINEKSNQTGVVASVSNAGELTLSSATSFTLELTATTTGLGTGTVTSAEAQTAAGSLDDLDISSYATAQMAILHADASMKQISEARAQLGALQSRFENAVANIQISAENATAARSRIMDTDFASETANLTRSQILQQAGNAMLSQANQLPQQVLSLLR